MKKLYRSLSLFEKLLLLFSLVFITAAFYIFDGKDYISFIASLIGSVSLIFCAKGHPIGQVLIIIFSLMYGYVSIKVGYYGEMLTYVFMTTPMAVYALVEWIRHPFDKESREVEVKRIGRKDIIAMAFTTAAITAAFYFILGYFNTAFLPVATLSVTTSFAAVFLSAKRSPYYAIAYGLNDVVLIILWSLSLAQNPGNISVFACFCVFLVHDIYGFLSWKKREEKQRASK